MGDLTEASRLSEATLVEALQPMRGFVTAACLQHLFASGLYDELQEESVLADLFADRRFDPQRTEALLRFLAVEGYVELDDGAAVLTERGAALAPARPWFEMMIGGYGGTFLQIGDRLRAGTPAATRDGALVAHGSCGISLHDSLPIVRKLLANRGRDYRLLLDLGCGSGVYLTELCEEQEGLRGIGLEPNRAAVAAARRWVETSPAASRIEIVHDDAVQFLQRGEAQPDLAFLGFVMHEVHGQRGPAGVRELFEALFSSNPGVDLVVIDVDLRWTDPVKMEQPLAKTYYNSYYLLHPFTNQRLAPLEYWEDLFTECGVKVVERLTTDPDLDSTELEVGWLLTGA